MGEILDVLKDQWHKFSGQKEQDNKRKLTQEARDFVLSYQNSPGFRERFSKVPSYIRQYQENPIYSNYPLTNVIYKATKNLLKL